MSFIFSRKRTYIIIAIILIISAITLMIKTFNTDTDDRASVQVDIGTVRQSVSVSGVAEAKNIVSLGFQTSGILQKLNVNEGDKVTTGTVLAELDPGTLSAEQAEILATIERAEAERAELIAGTSEESRSSADQTVTLKKNALENVIQIEAQKVANSRRALLSSGLSAYPEDKEEESIAPVVSGTYTCDQEGVYEIKMFRSQSDSGYSFNLTGLETGTFLASTNQAAPFGDCDLRLKFDPNSRYGNTIWYIDIPNKKSSTYTANKNAYELALVQQDSNIKLAEQELKVAEAEAIKIKAPARAEALAKANASISQAEARLAKLNIDRNNRLLTAPFDGTITKTNALPGEVVGSTPIITLLGENNFELVARIPEIDIVNITEGQKAEVRFDARLDEIVPATVNLISVEGSDIGGVTYFEVRLTFDEKPTWLRSGLNADLDIIVEEVTDTLRVPRRFVDEKDGVYSVVLNASNQRVATTTVDVVLVGNDGYVAVNGLTEGDIVVAP